MAGVLSVGGKLSEVVFSVCLSVCVLWGWQEGRAKERGLIEKEEYVNIYISISNKEEGRREEGSARRKERRREIRGGEDGAFELKEDAIAKVSLQLLWSCARCPLIFLFVRFPASKFLFFFV